MSSILPPFATWFWTTIHTHMANFVTFESSSGNCMVVPIVEPSFCHYD